MRLTEYLYFVYRLLGTAFMWGLFGIGGLLVGFLVLPFVRLLVRERVRQQAIARGIIAGCFGVFIRVTCALRLISCHVTGRHHHDPASGYLILANHPSLIDVVILIWLFPQVECVIKDAITRNPVLKMSVGVANYITNSEPAELLDTCSRRLRSGSSLVLFPEGTRTAPGETLKFKPGAAEVALRADARILPIVIDCRPRYLAKGDPWYRLPARPPHYDIRILAPRTPGEFVAAGSGNRAARQMLNRELEALFQAELP